MVRANFIKTFPFILIIILALLILLPGINKPFIGHHDWNGVFYSNIARNYLRYGYLAAKLGQVTDIGVKSTKEFHYYTHYPPLFPLTLSLVYRFFGSREIISRLVPIGFTLAGLILFYLIGRRLKLSRLAALASLVVVATPMIRYFAKMPSQETLIIFFTCLSIWFYLKGLKLGFYLATLANALSGWAGYFIYPLLLIHSRLFQPNKFKLVLNSIMILLAVFSLHLIHTFILTGSFIGGGLIEAFLLRLGLFPLLNQVEPELPGQFSLTAYLIKEARINVIYYTLTLMSFALIGLFIILKKIISKVNLNQVESIILLLFFWGLSYPLIFSNVVFVHEYFNFFFVPFLALNFAWLTQLLIKKNSQLIIFIFLIAGLIFFERNRFYQALNQTQAYLPGYKLGTLINQTVPSDQTAYVVAGDNFTGSQGIFIEYYADRQVIFITKQLNLPSSAKYIFSENAMIN